MEGNTTPDSTITVRVWTRTAYKGTTNITEEVDSHEYELPIANPTYGTIDLHDDERIILADHPEHHNAYAFDVLNHTEPITLNVQTNDRVHDPTDWNDPIEGGLRFSPRDDYPPFKCELWGRTIMWAEQPTE